MRNAIPASHAARALSARPARSVRSVFRDVGSDGGGGGGRLCIVILRRSTTRRETRFVFCIVVLPGLGATGRGGGVWSYQHWSRARGVASVVIVVSFVVSFAAEDRGVVSCGPCCSLVVDPVVLPCCDPN